MRRSQKSKITGLERKLGKRQCYFDDLPSEQQRFAETYLRKMLTKRRALHKPITGWVLPILIGQARRLAKNPPSSAWGRSMLAKRGGLAVQKKYRREGNNPTPKVDSTLIAEQSPSVELCPLSSQETPIQPPRPERRSEIDILHQANMQNKWYRDLYGDEE